MTKNIMSIEPTAEIRQIANITAQLFKGLLDEGFNEKQALYLLGNMMRQNNETPGGDSS